MFKQKTESAQYHGIKSIVKRSYVAEWLACSPRNPKFASLNLRKVK